MARIVAEVQSTAFMRSAFLFVGFALVVCALSGRNAAAQEPPPRIPLVAVDVHGAILNFPDDPSLAASRGLAVAQLPGAGFGGDLAAHVYPFKWRAVTLGIGGRLAAVRAHRDAQQTGVAESPTLAPVAERFTYLGPELSLNFGSGAGWSYLSGGLSGATWSVVPEGRNSLSADDEKLKTIAYGGGARWFAKPHIAFSFDVRFYAVNPSTPAGGLPPGPRTTLVIVGAGVSLK